MTASSARNIITKQSRAGRGEGGRRDAHLPPGEFLRTARPSIRATSDAGLRLPHDQERQSPKPCVNPPRPDLAHPLLSGPKAAALFGSHTALMDHSSREPCRGKCYHAARVIARRCRMPLWTVAILPGDPVRLQEMRFPRSLAEPALHLLPCGFRVGTRCV